MHNCEEFRERITEHIIDRENVAAMAEFHRELSTCASCSEFCAESQELMEALSEIDLSISERQWNGIQQRLNAHLLASNENSNVVAGFSPRRRQDEIVETRAKARDYIIGIPLGVAAAALLVISVSLGRVATPVSEAPRPPAPVDTVYVEHTVPLDPVTVDFLEQSELLLRNVMKIEATDKEDIQDAKQIAGEHLAELPQRREAAAEVPPVVDVMQTYETVLRDIRNVDERSAKDDINDIQRRIQRNGLIATMKTFQPRVTEVSFGMH
jgi:cell fate (sporulation/competence/biofilm development) regulator YlbF (YheA/YmcA/DUF963 family)